MFAIFNTVKTVFEKGFSNHPEEFRKGFLACLELFKIGYERSTLINYEVENLQLRRELETIGGKFAKERSKYVEKITTLEKELKVFIENNEPDNNVLRRKMRLKIYHMVFSGESDEQIVKELKKYVNDWNTN
ncbi:MAG TPA: hypothetical protein VI757_10315 [Bacteroidia bacterium]|nr:hypothetical protein [Bacteroidia bacterium]